MKWNGCEIIKTNEVTLPNGTLSRTLSSYEPAAGVFSHAGVNVIGLMNSAIHTSTIYLRKEAARFYRSLNTGELFPSKQYLYGTQMGRISPQTKRQVIRRRERLRTTRDLNQLSANHAPAGSMSHIFSDYIGRLCPMLYFSHFYVFICNAWLSKRHVIYVWHLFFLPFI